MDLEPRRARPPFDWDALLALIRGAFAEHEGRIDPPSSAGRLTAKDLERTARDGEIWVIGDPPEATVTLAPRPGSLYLGKLAVAASRRGQGLARALVALAQARARARGLPALELQTRVELRENHAAFEAMGFRRVAETAHPGYDRPTSVTYRKAVAAEETSMSDTDPETPPPGGEDARPQPAGGDARPQPAGEDARHAAKMAKKKAARDKIMATKTEERGLVIVHTGKGKGKSSAAFGMIFRCIGHGMPCAVVQFIKGGMGTGERDLIERHFSDLCAFHTMGEGFTWETQDRARDKAMAEAAWDKARELIRDERHRMVLLDEINIALRYEYIDLDEVLAFLRDEKPASTHVVLTGRNAAPELIEAADLVTEMELLKHPFRSGVKAQAGVEF